MNANFSPMPVLGFGLLYCVVLPFRRGQSVLSGATGVQHSAYNGYPLLCRFVPWCSEATVKRLIEPLFVLVIGVLLTPLCPPLLIAFGIGAVCMHLTNLSGYLQLKVRLQQMNDQVIEQRFLAEQFRAQQSDGF